MDLCKQPWSIGQQVLWSSDLLPSDLDTSLQSTGERSLAPPPGQDLGFHHNFWDTWTVCVCVCVCVCVHASVRVGEGDGQWVVSLRTSYSQLVS